MAREIRPFDVGNMPELLRIAEEVKSSGEPRVLRNDDEVLAMVVPVPTRRRSASRKLSAADRKAFLSSAGGWKDVDTDRLLKDIYASRRLNDSRPSTYELSRRHGSRGRLPQGN